MSDEKDLSTREGALGFAEFCRGKMREEFEREGCFEVDGYPFAGFVFATYDPDACRATERVEPLPCALPAWVNEVLPPSQHTRLFGMAVRDFARLTRALGVMVMSEAWVAESVESRDDLQANLEDHPGRGEALFMLLEHRETGRLQWRADISRTPTRVGEWCEIPYRAVCGRLVGLSDEVPPPAKESN